MRSDEPPPDRGFLEEEHRVEAHSDAFKKELGLRDLVLTQIVFVVGTSWVGTAAKLGPSQTAYWLFAILLFYLPIAAVIIYLNRIMPLEGGLYQWAKLGFNEFTGFIVAWNLWLPGISVMAGTGLVIATNLPTRSVRGRLAARQPTLRLRAQWPPLCRPDSRHHSRAQHREMGPQRRRRSSSHHLWRARRPALHRPRHGQTSRLSTDRLGAPDRLPFQPQHL
jgi:hypothetical protein